MNKRGRKPKKLNTQESCKWLKIGEDKFRGLVTQFGIEPELSTNGAKLYTLAQLKQIKGM